MATVPERCDPATKPDAGGRRATDPSLSTRNCADRLGVTPKFIVGEILDGRLDAHVRRLRGLRAVYRISEAQFAAYLRHYWPSMVRTG